MATDTLILGAAESTFTWKKSEVGTKRKPKQACIQCPTKHMHRIRKSRPFGVGEVTVLKTVKRRGMGLLKKNRIPSKDHVLRHKLGRLHRRSE